MTQVPLKLGGFCAHAGAAVPRTNAAAAKIENAKRMGRSFRAWYDPAGESPAQGCFKGR
jgi:hypothetical protein